MANEPSAPSKPSPRDTSGNGAGRNHNVADPELVDVINQTSIATLSPQVVQTSGAGKAYQSVAQSAAIAVQDATDNLRNISTITTTATGVALSELIAGNGGAAEALKVAQVTLAQGIKDYAAICDAASNVLKDFPSG